MSVNSRASIAEAYRRIRAHIRKTPLIEVEMPGIACPVALKLECQQHTGSFKARGAMANLTALEVPPAGVTAASGGNHGLAVAWAAARRGIAARIFVPAIASPAKIARIRATGAEVVVEGENYAAALALCQAWQRSSGALAIHAYDAPLTIDGQGTIGLELEDQRPDADTLLVAVGGGGLIAGIATWWEGMAKVVGVEPQGCPTLDKALQAGRPVDITPSGIAADSLGASRIGSLALAVARRAVAQVALVADTDIRRAQRWLWDEVRIVAEPGGAAAVAALLSGAYRPQGKERVLAVVCGANTDPETFARAIAAAG
jgi:threonine dehydratase